MQRISIPEIAYFTANKLLSKHFFKTLTCISCITFILYFIFLTPANAQTSFKQAHADIEIFYKEKNLNYICVIDFQNHKEETSKNKYCLKASGYNIIQIDNKSNRPQTPGQEITLHSENGLPICINSKNISTRCYNGIIQVTAKNNRFKIINQLPIIDYLYSVVGSELPSGWPEEAVKAQTIAAHSYLLYSLNNNIPIKDTTQSQFYGGVEYIKPEYKNYIDEVKDIILVDDKDQPVEALFHSTCAGKTLNNEEVFGGQSVSYLRETECKYDKESNFYREKVFSIPEEELKRDIKAKTLQPVHSESGDLEAVKVDNNTLSPYQFWLKLGQNIGWQAAPGVKYNIKCSEHICNITSHGAGHAVGLCQWGSRGMAKKGFNYQDILRYYYKNVFFSVLDKKSNKFKRFQPE